MTPYNEEERRWLAAVFVSPGWQLVKTRLEQDKAVLAKDLIYSGDRNSDDMRRAGIVAIDKILGLEVRLFAPPETIPIEPFRLPEMPSGNRYA